MRHAPRWRPGRALPQGPDAEARLCACRRCGTHATRHEPRGGVDEGARIRRGGRRGDPPHLQAIKETGRSAYTGQQTEAWLGAPVPLSRWNVERLQTATFVAELDGVVARFADLDGRGYIDRLFVDPAVGRRGVASALLEHLRSTAAQRGPGGLSTHASVVARPVFEKAGLRVVHEEVVTRAGVQLTRFLMRSETPGRSTGPAAP